MKIAIIVSEFPKISETFILNQITGLIDLGNEVDIFVFKESDEKKIHPDVIKYNLFSKITFLNRITLPKGKIERIAKAIKIIIRYFLFYPKEIIRCLDYGKHSSKYYALNNLFKLKAFLRNKYDVIHCHYGPNGVKYLFLKEILSDRVKYVTTFHAYDITRFLNKSKNGFYEELFQKGDLFLPVSKLWEKKLEVLGCPREKLVVHKMGIDIEKINIKNKSIENDEIEIITVARLVEKKGLEYSISAVARLIKKYPRIRYNIVGDGYLRENLERLILDLDLNEKIKILGWLDEDEVFKLMHDSDIFILTSVTSQDGDQEGIPVSLMEAMAVGLPVISTYHSGIPELVTDGKSGFLVPEKDVYAITEKLEYLVTHQKDRMKMGRFGRPYIKDQHDILRLNRNLLNLYKAHT